MFDVALSVGIVFGYSQRPLVPKEAVLDSGNLMIQQFCLHNIPDPRPIFAPDNNSILSPLLP